ncbi:XRE family transcriptional regulator [Sphingopyxis macrogoltabida]|uniref:HTH cro/C1-type domain-containing protein n=1 Tax=Sphingopyxis macrogoltabida TaxID=33050 RepID=A0AAC9AXI6_SPHMC|nr:XRE family transcriptional regulator [Sphingopyxis macrogoltabida]ALJ15343.1 hypothetical protein LH19_20910 [Sphingopyxis macrogoltabida]AMU91592.1 hypothetical protein ATM17_21490 [Sphingopyxis macrogoltabida]
MSETTDLANRIAERLTLLGMSPRDASMRACDQPDVIRNISEKGSIPSAFRLLKLAQVLETTVGWLLGEVSQAPADNDDDVEIQQWDVSYGMGGGGFLDLPTTGETHKFSRSWLRQFTSAPPEKVFLADSTGDSMFPTILNADMVMIDTTQREVRMADRIWAAAFGQVGIIKRLRPSPDGSVKILSDNQAVPPDTAYDGELFVVGRVVAIVRKM